MQANHASVNIVNLFSSVYRSLDCRVEGRGLELRVWNMSYEKQVIWEFVADGRAGYRNVYIVAASPK